MSFHLSSISVLSCRDSIGVIVSLLLLAGCNRANSLSSPVAKQAAHSRTTRLENQFPDTGDEEKTVPVFVSKPSPDEPVKVAMQFRPAIAAPGDVVELIVLARIADAHYLHAAGSSGQPFEPVAITSLLPDEVESLGDWQLPAPIKVHGASAGYRDSMQLKRSLRVRSNAKHQTLRLTAELKYQACNDELCWPPTMTKLSASLIIGSQSR
jgi:DsbC/DsbD-like thiol-disulfide interchange protein